MIDLGDYLLEDNIDVYFNTHQTDGTPIALSAGNVDVYEDNGTTQIAGSDTLTADFDTVTGLNQIRIAATAANGYERGKAYHAVLSAGTVDSVSVVGYVIARWSIEQRHAWQYVRANHLITGTFGATSEWAGSGVNITVAPLTSTILTGNFTVISGSIYDLQIPQNASGTFVFAIVESDLVTAISQAGDDIRFVVHDRDGTETFSRNSTAGDITIGGTDNNVLSVSVTSTNTATANERLEYKLWNITDEDVLASGRFQIKLAPLGS